MVDVELESCILVLPEDLCLITFSFLGANPSASCSLYAT